MITRPDKYVGVTTFQFPGSEPVRFDVFNFQPDLLIGKSRTHTYNFEWVDSVTGVTWLKLNQMVQPQNILPILQFDLLTTMVSQPSTNFSVLIQQWG